MEHSATVRLIVSLIRELNRVNPGLLEQIREIITKNP